MDTQTFFYTYLDEYRFLITDSLTRGATYAIKATAYSEFDYVENPVSDTTTVSDGLLLGDYNQVSVGYFFDDGLGRQRWNWPVVKEGFNLAEGGDAGVSFYYPLGLGAEISEPMLHFEDYVEVKETSPGSLYSYDFYGISWHGTPTFVGWMEIYPDGTFEAYALGAGGCASSTIQGIWIDNGDGTATLSYNHAAIIKE